MNKIRGVLYFFVCALGIGVVAFLIYSGFENEQETAVFYSAVATSAATVAIAILTMVLAIETWRMRNQQHEQIKKEVINSVRPLVVVEISEGRVINDRIILIKNMGKGIAFDVGFEVTGEGNSPEAEEKIIKNISDHGFIKRGMRNLGIGQVVDSHVFMFPEIGKGGMEACINIKVSFKDIYGTAYENKFIFDMAEHENTNRLGGKPENERNDHLKKIAETLNNKLK
ncbi:hypothetical protein [Vreelandella sp. EE7]